MEQFPHSSWDPDYQEYTADSEGSGRDATPTRESTTTAPCGGGALPRAFGGRPTAPTRPQRANRPAVPAMPSRGVGGDPHPSHPRTPGQRYLQPPHHKAPGNERPLAHRNRGPAGPGGACASQREPNLQGLEPARGRPQRRPRRARSRNAAARRSLTARSMPGLPGQAPPAHRRSPV